MSSTNPYYDPSADADLLAPSEPKTSGSNHTYDGSICPTCKVIHQISMPPDIPQDVLDRLSKFLDSLPSDALAQHIIITSVNTLGNKVLRDFVAFVADVDKTATGGYVMRAVCEVLDELSDGALSKKLRLYEAEDHLISTHVVLKSANRLADKMSERNDLGEHKDRILENFDTILRHTMERLAAATEAYRVEAANQDLPLDESLINNGVYTGPMNLYVKNFMVDPYKDHIKSGSDEGN